MKRLIAERPDRLGILLTPSNGNAEWWQPEHTWACDNDCFRALDAPAYLRMVARVAGFKSRPSWIACPDAVGDMGETWRRYTIWSRVLLEMGLPVALVMQDGLERLKWRARLPSTWDELSAVFVGGSTAWKLSDEAGQLTLQAHERGLKVHYGRVNTFRRILWLGRVMYGSDFPYVSFAEARTNLAAQLNSHGFTPAEQSDIFYGTADRVFGTNL
jgi:hypothetical protein